MSFDIEYKDIMIRKERYRYLFLLFVTSFILAVSVALVAYIQSSLLETFISEKFLGLIFVLANLLTFIAVNFYPLAIRKLGNYLAFILVLLVNGCTLLLLPYSGETLILVILFCIYSIASMLLWINLDIFIQDLSEVNETGRIRGLNLTLMNLGWVISPSITGYLMSKSGFPDVYGLSGALSILVALLVWMQYQPLIKRQRSYTIPHFGNLIKRIYRRFDLFSVFIIAFILSFFYAWMVVYTPLYLRNLGFSFVDIGFMFTIMLIPFVIFEYPVGYIADKYLGETEMISFGLVVMALTSLSMLFVSSFWGFAIVLFLSRVGASIVEALRDSYFYKKLGSTQVELINLFRDTGPLAYVIAPLLASGILIYFPMSYLYPVLAVICFSGLYFTLKMPDTK